MTEWETEDWTSGAKGLLEWMHSINSDQSIMLMVRHSHREMLHNYHDTMNAGLTELGKRLSREMGNRIPTERKAHIFLSVIPIDNAVEFNRKFANPRSKQLLVTQYGGSCTILLVAYCILHVSDDLQKTSNIHQRDAQARCTHCIRSRIGSICHRIVLPLVLYQWHMHNLDWTHRSSRDSSSLDSCLDSRR